MAYTVILEGGSPWGFRLQGGDNFKDAIRIAKLNPNSKAYNQGVKVGDQLDRINGASTSGLKLNEALQLIRNANNKLELELRRSDRKKTSIPEIQINGPSVNGNGHLSDSDYYYSSCDEEGIVRTNAITNYTSSGSGSGHQSDGDNSGSSSGSQSSVVHVVGPYKGPLAETMKNIANSTNGPGGGEQQGDGSYKTSVWTPFGPNKVVTYKPVSFNASGSIINRTPSPTKQPQQQQPFSQPTASPISTSYSSASSASFGFGTQSPSRNAAFSSNTNSVAPTTFNNQGQKDENLNSERPSFSNFNGSGSVVVTSPGSSSYTSITMSSKKAEDVNPTQKFSRFGSPLIVLEGQQSPTKTAGPSSPSKSQFESSKPVSEPTSSGSEPFKLSDPPKGHPRPGSPLKFGPSNPAKPSFGPSSPTKSSFGPGSPTKSGPPSVLASPKSLRRPMSPSKSVTFGPVTSVTLGDNSEPTEPQLSVSETRSLFEQKTPQPQLPRKLPAQPQPYKTVTPPSMTQVKSPPFAAKTTPPSNTTVGATYRPLSPRVQSPVKKPAPAVVPKSPSTKSKGLSMFLNAQQRYHDDEDQLSEFTDTEEAPEPKSPSVAAPKQPAKPPQQPSPIVGRAMPIKVTSMGREGINEQQETPLNNNTVNAASSIKVSSTTTESPQPAATQPKTIAGPQSGLWQSELESPLKTADVAKDRPAETVQAAPALWQPDKGYKPVKLDAAKLKSPDTGMKSSSPSVKPEESFAWKPPERTTVSSSTLTTTTTTTTATLPTSSMTSYSSHNGSISHHQESSSGLPAYQSPTITLLQKSRDLAKASENLRELLAGNIDIPPDVHTVRVEENEVPDDAVLVGTKETTEGDKVHYDSFYRLPGQQKETKTQKVQKTKSQYEGIGPTEEKTGVPIVPRGSVDEKNHKQWYKQMYKSLQKQDRKDGDSEVSASESEEPNKYKPTYVFPEEDTESEFEDRGSTMSLDRSAGSHSGYGRKAYTLPHARYREEKYKNQPRSIENYEPGFSSIAFREARVSPIPITTKDAPKSPEPKRDNKQAKSPDKGDRKSDKSYLYNPPIEKPGQFSKYIYSDSEHEIKKKERALSPASDVENREAYRRFQRGGDVPYEGLRFPIPPKKDEEAAEPEDNVPRTVLQSPILVPNRKHTRSKSTGSSSTDSSQPQSAVERLGVTSPPPAGLNITTRERSQSASERHDPRQRYAGMGGRSPTGSWDRRTREEEIARRKQEMHRITAEEKRKRMEMEMRSNEARRHNDFLTPSQKSPISLNRYEDPPDAPALQRPKKKMTQYKGKAKALYSFKSQNTKELSFRRNDIILLTRQIDRNWYEGEHHGRVGIFPVNYVEVLTSLDEAREAAAVREGQARARHSFTAHTNMELTFRKGDMVTLVRRIDENWYEGRVGHKQGIFPINYVDVLKEPDTPYSSYAPTPMTGSPGQLSPVSTISNGPAPTIPSAPISPRSSIDNFDFSQPFNYGQMSAASTLQRGASAQSYNSDYGMDMLRPSSALGGRSDGYDSMQHERQNLMNRPSSAVPFSDYYGRHSMRDSGFHSSDESRYQRQQPRQQDPVSRSMSNSYEARIKQSAAPRPLDDISLITEETKYPKYRALYTYRPQNADELELQEGDIVNVMEICDDDWYVGTSERTKEFGTFPGNYVRML